MKSTMRYEVEQELRSPGVFDELDDSRIFARILQDPDHSGEIIQNAISRLSKNFDNLKDHPKYQQKVKELAAADMLLTPGYELAAKLERYKRGHPLSIVHMFSLARRLFEFKLQWRAEP